MDSETDEASDQYTGVGFLPVFAGTSAFFGFQYCRALARLANSSSGMENKFSALAKEKYMGFLIRENAHTLIAYLLLALVFAFVLRPFVSMLCAKPMFRRRMAAVLLAVAGSFAIHAYFVLRLVDTRPYFLSEAKFGYWYYELLNSLPDDLKTLVLPFLFTVFPLGVIAYVLWWHWWRTSPRWRGIAAVSAVAIALLSFIKIREPQTSGTTIGGMDRPNVIIIGSDSLRADKLGCNGYVPRRTDGAAGQGVSPRIDELAARSANFANCFTPIASTLESGTSLMTSLYPQTHGLRQMYPNRETVDATKAKIIPLAKILSEKGYDTAAFGDWCAGYYELMPLGFEHASVSSFDNFKIYMSQAVVMAHFVIPLYFDHALGYEIFPELGSFAQFVTPDVVTKRVEQRMDTVAESGEPFFWHVFYSCNHLPYRSDEPYASMFTDPDYDGPNKNGVDFDIDSFIGGTDLEDKWNALPEKEIQQIRDLYDGCTRQFDAQVGRLVDALEKRGLADNTVIIVTADHGDNLYEEGVTLGHGLTFAGAMHANHIPLVVHVPGEDATTIPETVRLIDIAPTIADLAGAEKPSSWEGKSFAGWLDGSETPTARAFYGETGFPFIQFRVEGIERPSLPPMDRMTWIDDSFNYQFVLRDEFAKPLVDAKQRCLMTPDWKLICTPTAEGNRHFGLFFRQGEEDVASANPEVLAPMRAALERWMDDNVETPLETIFPNGEL
ncbi:MAG: sulfatase-like hydrolase/transferase [Luteolibacter sp.]